MRAARLYGVGDIRCEDVPEPELRQPDEVMLSVRAAGVCGSDLHNYRTGRWFGRLPITPGHEFVAEVVAVGSAVTDLTVGEQVVADSRVCCGHCAACVQGAGNRCRALGYVGEVCEGGFAERVVLPRHQLHRVPAAVAPAIAVLAEPLAVALHVVRRLAPCPGEPILVTGGGPIGGLTLVFLAHEGYGPLYLVERHSERAERVRAATGAALVSVEQLPSLSLRYAVDATGVPTVVRAVADALAPGGRLALVGLGDEPTALDLSALVERELEIVGCSVYAGELPAAIAQLEALTGRLQGLTSAPHPLDALPAVYASLLAGGSPALKTLIVPSAAGLTG
jgi:(R,R)-butanediol dehydrogenase/meso-butanediol dehydrogenase/diacetyl reductase